MHIYLRTPSKVGQVIVIVVEDLNPDFYITGHSDGIENVSVWDLVYDNYEHCDVVRLFGADCETPSQSLGFSTKLTW